MQKILRFFLASGRKHRCLMVGVILWLLRLLHDAENDEMRRNSELLDSFESENKDIPRLEYGSIEEEYLSCEGTLGFLESAIEDLEFAY